jgi:hypothetical protein
MEGRSMVGEDEGASSSTEVSIGALIESGACRDAVCCSAWRAQLQPRRSAVARRGR